MPDPKTPPPGAITGANSAAIRRQREEDARHREAADRQRAEAAASASAELEELSPEERDAYRAELRAELAREDDAARLRDGAGRPTAAEGVARQVAEKHEASGRKPGIPGKL